MKTMSNSALRSLLAALAAWTAIGLIFGYNNWYHFRSTSTPLVWWHATLLSLVDWWSMAALSPIIVYIGRRLPVSRDRWAHSLPAHVAGFLAYWSLSTLLSEALERLFVLIVSIPPHFRALLDKKLSEVLLRYLAWDLILYIGVLAVYSAVDYARRYRQGELAASQLQTQLAQAQLQVLRAQLQPHFLFNTLNVIAALVHKDPDSAERMIARLADLLRMSLDLNGRQEVSLREELTALDKYVDIQKTRFRGRLRVEMMVEPQAMDMAVPSLILQPLVENAIRHGIAPRVEGGALEVRALVEGEALRMEVRDDGRGFHAAGPDEAGGGVGLVNTRARIERLYGSKGSLEIDNAPSGGAIVRMSIPARRCSPELRSERSPRSL